MNSKRRKSPVQIGLSVLLFITCINAIGGGLYGILGATAIPKEWLEGSVFHSYFIPGLFLAIVVGGSALAAMLAVWNRAAGAGFRALISGLILLLWIAVQLGIIGFVSFLQPVMAAFGLAIVILSLLFRYA